MKYLALNNIAQAGLDKFPASFEQVSDIKDADAVILRSYNMLDMEMPEQLRAIARSGAGTNNIPVDKCAEKGIVVFNTPGANANGVKELVILGLILAARDAKGGMKWVDDNKGDENISKTMEKAKSQFAGTEIKGKTLGIIGLGAIGVLVANNAVDLGMKVIGYDPFLSVGSALHLNPRVRVVTNVDDLYADSDYITIHVPMNDSTKGMLNGEAMEKMKDGVAILNFARDGLVCDACLTKYLANGKVRKYVTDLPNYTTANLDNVIAFPHLGASTEESETNCAIMAAEELTDFLENGNITNSVNFPNISLGAATKPMRLCVAHANVPNVISQLTTILGASNANISDMVSKSRGDYAFALFDLDHKLEEEELEKVKKVPGVIRVNVIEK
ncbi:MAG: 3-phosphoglycerate dehydrogenase [Lachnospiraceae bacterium]|nr:3-phosphoglycerate dehydrogenase [Lachnospiraceae bacterium]MBR0086412.1 3-phosphoglycerate dehydrogenase [Lachnospiraceae bacterium]